MARTGIRMTLTAGGFALTLVAAACSGSGGSNRVSASPTTVGSSDSSAPADSTAPATKAKAPAAPKKTLPSATSATTTPAGFVVVPGRGTSPTTITVFVTSPTVAPAGGTSPPPTSARPTPTTAKPTPTTVPSGPKPYDPSKPIDLSGTPGVTPAQLALAEKLVRDTLRDLPKYATTAAAYADGFRDIGDFVPPFTSVEHWVNWSYGNDGHVLDSKRPESLVYAYPNGHNNPAKLVSAMYSLGSGARFTDVPPNAANAIMQWHVHLNLCLSDDPHDPLRKYVSSLPVGPNSPCPAGSSKLGASPMIHVWIIKNKCGPFAALEGIGAGTVPDGQTALCDTGHGA